MPGLPAVWAARLVRGPAMHESDGSAAEDDGGTLVRLQLTVWEQLL